MILYNTIIVYLNCFIYFTLSCNVNVNEINYYYFNFISKRGSSSIQVLRQHIILTPTPIIKYLLSIHTADHHYTPRVLKILCTAPRKLNVILIFYSLNKCTFRIVFISTCNILQEHNILDAYLDWRPLLGFKLLAPPETWEVIYYNL